MPPAPCRAGDTELMTKALRVTLQNARGRCEHVGSIAQAVGGEGGGAGRGGRCARRSTTPTPVCVETSRVTALRFRSTCPEGLTVWADELQVQQVLFNLLLNGE